jgi:hypothetical protein
MKRILFEPGLSFTWFDIDGKGIVVDSDFDGDLFKGVKVVDHTVVKPGQRIYVHTLGGISAINISSKVKSIIPQ